MLRIRIFRLFVVLVSPGGGRSFPSKFWLSETEMAWDGGLLSTGVCPGPAIAFAYSSGTVAAGEYEYVMEGEKLWRNRANGPMPPRKPKNGGPRPRLKLSRFPCCTKRPPVNEFRTANGPGPVFAIPTLGLSFQLERNMIGRPIAVLQSTEVLKPPRRYWVTVIESLGSGVSGLGARNEVWNRPVESPSTIRIELLQVNVPNRSGVWSEKVEIRVFPTCEVVSTAPPTPGTRSGARGVWNPIWLVKERFGDQVSQLATSSSLGLRVSEGSSMVPLPSVMLSWRLPPMSRLPQRYRLVKRAWLVICWVEVTGSTEFRSTTDGLVL